MTGRLPAALALLGCGAGGDGAALGPFVLHVAYGDYPGALLAAWGLEADDLWLVGGGAGAGEPSVVLHRGSVFEAAPVETAGTLWWAWGAASDDMWAVGEQATVLRFRAGRFEPVAVGPPDATFYGVWGAAADDVWIVGATAAQQGLIFHFDGASFEEVRPIAGGERADAALFKVWGSSAYDVFVVGDRGAVLRFDGARWERMEVGTEAFLFTVWGTGPNDAWAVGGLGVGVVLHWDGTAWRDATPAQAPGLRGVTGTGGVVYVVGENGYAARLVRGAADARTAWEIAPPAADPAHVLHAIFPVGGRVFAVGGTLNAKSLPWRGSVLYSGDPIEAGGPGVYPVAPPADAGPAPDGWVPPDGSVGTLGPGAPCPELAGCEAGLYCWYFPTSHEYRCTRSCDFGGCGEFGAGSCCFVPGPQSSAGICGPAGVVECGGP